MIGFRGSTARERPDPEPATVEPATQTLQDPFIKECTVNHIKGPTIVYSTFLYLLDCGRARGLQGMSGLGIRGLGSGGC